MSWSLVCCIHDAVLTGSPYENMRANVVLNDLEEAAIPTDIALSNHCLNVLHKAPLKGATAVTKKAWTDGLPSKQSMTALAGRTKHKSSYGAEVNCTKGEWWLCGACLRPTLGNSLVSLTNTKGRVIPNQCQVIDVASWKDKEKGWSAPSQFRAWKLLNGTTHPSSNQKTTMISNVSLGKSCVRGWAKKTAFTNLDNSLELTSL